MVDVGPGRFAPVECEGCGEVMVVEMTRVAGTTYREARFLEEVLPTLDGVERVDHPDADVYLYADPETIGIHRVDDE